MSQLTQARLKELFSYDPDSGVFIRKVRTAVRTHIGDVVGTINENRRLVTSINYKNYMLHNLAWLYVYGAFPKKELDHINHNGLDNRIDNLRIVTHKQNARNSSISMLNTSGCTGVYWEKIVNKWVSRITVDGIRVRLGSFINFDEAVNARKIAESVFDFHENHGKTKEELI